jgi:hypothetical protein
MTASMSISLGTSREVANHAVIALTNTNLTPETTRINVYENGPVCFKADGHHHGRTERRSTREPGRLGNPRAPEARR